jgi:hypothetical protein
VLPLLAKRGEKVEEVARLGGHRGVGVRDRGGVAQRHGVSWS